MTFFCALDDSFALLLPNDSALLPPLCIWRMKKSQKPSTSRNGRPGQQEGGPRVGRRFAGGDLDAALEQLVGEPVVLLRRDGPELIAVPGDVRECRCRSS